MQLSQLVSLALLSVATAAVAPVQVDDNQVIIGSEEQRIFHIPSVADYYSDDEEEEEIDAVKKVKSSSSSAKKSKSKSSSSSKKSKSVSGLGNSVEVSMGKIGLTVFAGALALL